MSPITEVSMITNDKTLIDDSRHKTACWVDETRQNSIIAAIKPLIVLTI
jgi:hypothetical protein